MKCPTCKGTGKYDLPTTTMTTNGYSKEICEITCFTCHGSGRITVKQHNDMIEARKIWCSCGNPSEETNFYDDGEHPTCSKHCYTCVDCGKIVQIG
jgi:hypothetical protein